MGRDLTVAVQHCKDNTVDNHRAQAGIITAAGCEYAARASFDYYRYTAEADGFGDDLTVVNVASRRNTVYIRPNHYPGGRQVKIAMKLLGSFAAIVLLVCGVVFAAGHYEIRSIATGSMRPQLPVHSLVLVHMTHTDFKKGDIISFHETNGQIVSHRFIGIDKKTGGIMTKGDANLTPDVHFTPLRNKDVVGKVVRHTDVFAFSFWRTWRGVAIMLLLLVIGWTLFSKTDEAPKTENENEDKKESDEKEDQPADASTPV